MVKRASDISLASKMLKKWHLYIFLLKTSAYSRHFDEIKYMSFLIKDDKSLEKYNEIWKKVGNSIKKDFDMNLYTMKNV